MCSGLGNTLAQEGNTGTVNFRYITFRNDIMAHIVKLVGAVGHTEGTQKWNL